MIGKTDVFIIVTMTIVILSMSYLFPALGMTGTSQNKSDVPTFNINSNQFEFSYQFPETPGKPGSGILNHSSTKFDDYRGFIQVELGKEANGDGRVYLVAIEENETHLINGTTVEDPHVFTSEGETYTHNAYGYKIDVAAQNLTHGVFEWNIQERPSDDASWITTIPILGGAYETGQMLASWVAYLGGVLYWISATIVYTAINILSILVQTIVFFVSFIGWLTNTYWGILGGANSGWAQAILSIPGVLLSVELTKLVYMVVKMVPTT